MSVKSVFGLAFGIMLGLQAHATSVLLMGDSHTAGTFGQSLDQTLRASFDSVQTYGSCGSIISWWYSGHATTCGYVSYDENGKATRATTHATPKIQSLLATTPETIVVALGSNYARGYGDAQAKTEIRKLLKDIEASQARCFWIGPPDMRKFRPTLGHLVDLIRAEVSRSCVFIDSRELTRYPEQGGDGIHYEAAALKPIAIEWAKSIQAKIESGFKAQQHTDD